MDDHVSVSSKWADREEIGINAFIGKGGEQTFSIVFFTSLYPREVSFHCPPSYSAVVTMFAIKFCMKLQALLLHH